jgi:rhamnosyltransferase
MKIALIVPTYNAGANWRKWIEAVNGQTRRPDRIIVIDSSSTDETASIAREYGLEVHVIPHEEFDHGGTRQLGAELAKDSDILIFMTHDATLAREDAIEKLVGAFDDPKVGAAYGRQAPYPDAPFIEARNRSFNYPLESSVRGLADAPRLGFRTVFFSDAFGAYRREVLEEIGGFKAGTISMEDEYAAAKIVLAGHLIAYCAESVACHSHDYKVWDEFSRYFDFGVFHANESWIRERFGEAEGEGMRLVVTQLGFLLRNRPLLVVPAMARMAAKLAGLRLGRMEKRLPVALKRRIGMNKKYWMRTH